MSTLKDAFLILGIASAAACVAVVIVCVWALSVDRRQYGKWLWKDDD